MSSCVRVWSASVRTKRSLAQPVQTELSPVEAPCVCAGKGEREGGCVGGGREEVCGGEGERMEYTCMWEGGRVCAGGRRGKMCKGKTKEIEVIR